jgi:hypothetical protein
MKLSRIDKKLLKEFKQLKKESLMYKSRLRKHNGSTNQFPKKQMYNLLNRFHHLTNLRSLKLKLSLEIIYNKKVLI